MDASDDSGDDWCRLSSVRQWLNFHRLEEFRNLWSMQYRHLVQFQYNNFDIAIGNSRNYYVYLTIFL